MCTVTVVPVVGGFSLACNRDEKLTRPDAVPPARRQAGQVQATFPVDRQRGGTWIAANDAGLAFALLNRCDGPDERAVPGVLRDARPTHDRDASPARVDTRVGTLSRGVTTRGEIILRVLEATDLGAVQRSLQHFHVEQYEPFQLIVSGGRRLLVATSNGHALDIGIRALDAPVMFTSSSLGDRDAERVRAPLFDGLVRRSPHPLSGQRRFHDHQWPGCPSFSVRMRRADSRTVSRSVIQIHNRRLTFSYEALDD